MKIMMIGTGDVYAEAYHSSALIDGHILLDCPGGVCKMLHKKGAAPADIDLCVLTHFHGDHFLDLPILMLEEGRNPRESPFRIIGPKGTTKFVRSLFVTAYGSMWDEVFDNSLLEVLEIQRDLLAFEVDGYTVTAYPVEHGSKPDCYGYTIAKGGVTAGFSGDTSYCEGVERIAEVSDIMFYEMTLEKGNGAHSGYDDMMRLQEKFGDKIHPTHMGDEARALYAAGGRKPTADGQVFRVKPG